VVGAMASSIPPALSGRIFISYRREETAYPAGWLYDRLADRYGGDQVFKDVDSIRLGDDFVEMIASAVGSCDVLLALIGEEWLTITDEHGRRRLDDPDDFVRLEIEAALSREVRVIPILVDSARMPRVDELPASLAKLVRRQALELSPARFDFDTGRLLKVLDWTLAEVRTAQDHADEAVVPAGKAPNASTAKLHEAPERREQVSWGSLPESRVGGAGQKQAAKQSWFAGRMVGKPGGPAWWRRPIVWVALVIVAGLVTTVAVVSGNGGPATLATSSPPVTQPPQPVKLHLVGDAVTQGDKIRLTSAAVGERGAAWSIDRKNVRQPFTAAFHFQITDARLGGGADGIAFVIQNQSSSSRGMNGGGIGYDGIPNSLAVEFDTSLTPVKTPPMELVGDPNNHHIGVHTRGEDPNSADEKFRIGRAYDSPNLKDGRPHTARIKYNPGRLDIYLDDADLPVLTVRVNLATTLGLTNGMAWIGLTAATGDYTEQHEVWSITWQAA
jgi:Bacterial lectin/TIR domain